MSGATTRNPASASAGIWNRHEDQNSGKPCRSNTSGPPPAGAAPARSQRRDLEPPRVPELREAVQEHHERPLPRLDVVQPPPHQVGVALGHARPRGRAGAPRAPPPPPRRSAASPPSGRRGGGPRKARGPPRP